MKLTILGSNSAGNCYILQNANEALILEAGIKFSDVQKALNYDVQKVVACIASHEHGDHFKHVQEFMSRSIPVYASAGTWEAKGLKSRNILKAGQLSKFANFKIIPFDLKHDCNEPIGFLSITRIWETSSLQPTRTICQTDLQTCSTG